MNSIKLAEQDIGQLFQQIKVDLPDADPRCLALAKTGLQEAFHWFIRAVAKPLDVYELVLPTPESETFLTRLRVERDRTVEDLNKLSVFLEGDVSKLSKEAVSDLHSQKSSHDPIGSHFV